jgi:hypothetical protein
VFDVSPQCQYVDGFQQNGLAMSWGNLAGAVLLLLVAMVTDGLAQNLPSGSGKVPPLRRAPDGNIVVIPSSAGAPLKPVTGAVLKDRPAGPANSAVTLLGSEGPSKTDIFACAPQAVTCIDIVGTSGTPQHQVPVTFGQPFAPGNVPAGMSLTARDAAGNVLPLQIDQTSTFPDGSLRFAVLTTVLNTVDPKGRQTVNFFRDFNNLGGDTPFDVAAALRGTGYDLTIEADLYAAQLSVIIFGNREGHTPGIPFRAGERVTIALGGAPEDRFTLTITPEMAGGDFGRLTKIAEAFVPLINASRNFRAYKVGSGGGYEKLWVTTRNQPVRPFDVRFIYGGAAKLSVRKLQPMQPVRRYIANVRSLLDKVIAPSLWLAGPVTNEIGLSTPLIEADTGAPHPLLAVRFDVRLHASQRRVRTNVVFENTWTYSPNPGNLTYDVTIRQGNAVAYKRRNILHYHHARWRVVVWSGDEPAVHVRHHAPSLFDSRAVWPYDTSIVIPERVLAQEAERLAKADTAPMGTAFIEPYMPMAGGRADIGPLPRWTAIYLLSQDPRAKAAMLANGEAAGSVPVHYRDQSTDQPVSLDEHPGLTMRFGQSTARDALPEVVNGVTPWFMDAAHQPSLAYTPYLITGDRYSLDEVLFWANWNMGHLNPGYRGEEKGLVGRNEIRAQAWSLRALGEAAHVLSDHHPMKSYFVSKLRGNLEWYVQRYPRNPDRQASAALGWFEAGGSGTTAPWQMDFVAIVLGRLAAAEEPLAGELFHWVTRFTVGRWLNEAQGYCRAMAPTYHLKIRQPDQRFIETWQELLQTNWPDLTSCPATLTEGHPSGPTGYAAYARAMLAVAADLGIDGAGAAYTRLRAETPAMTTNMAQDPTWALAPRRGQHKP